MKDRKYYDLYELRELTESIYGIRQAMGLLKNCSYEYNKVSEIYDELWKMESIEHKASENKKEFYKNVRRSAF